MRALRVGIASGSIALVGLLLIGRSLGASLAGAAGGVIGVTLSFAVFSPWFPTRNVNGSNDREIRDELETDLAKLEHEHKDYS
jgi:hypothetical protein